MISHDNGFSHSATLQCPDCPGYPHRDCAFSTYATGSAPLPDRSEWCHADTDGECVSDECPQLRDGEPGATGRHCPRDAITPQRGEDALEYEQRMAAVATGSAPERDELTPLLASLLCRTTGGQHAAHSVTCAEATAEAARIVHAHVDRATAAYRATEARVRALHQPSRHGPWCSLDNEDWPCRTSTARR